MTLVVGNLLLTSTLAATRATWATLTAVAISRALLPWLRTLWTRHLFTQILCNEFCCLRCAMIYCLSLCLALRWCFDACTLVRAPIALWTTLIASFGPRLIAFTGIACLRVVSAFAATTATAVAAFRVARWTICRLLWPCGILIQPRYWCLHVACCFCIDGFSVGIKTLT